MPASRFRRLLRPLAPPLLAVLFLLASLRLAAADDPPAGGQPPSGEHPMPAGPASATRPAPSPTPAPTSPADPALILVYRGVLGERAILENLDSGQQKSLALGDEILGYRVTEIRPRHVLLKKGEATLKLRYGPSEEETDDARGTAPPYPYSLPGWLGPLRAHLASTRTDIDALDAPLSEILLALRAKAGVPILFHPAAAPLGARRLTVRVQDVSVEESFRLLLLQFGLTIVFENGLVVVTTIPAARENAIERTEAVLRELDAARNRAAPGASVEDRRVHDAIAAVRVTLKAEMLPLTEVVDLLRQQAPIPILLDTAAFDPRAEEYAVSASFEAVSMEAALAGILTPLGLAHAIRGGVLVLSTPAALAEEPVGAKPEEILPTKVTVRFQDAPLYRAVTETAREAGLEPVIAPELWGPTPKFTSPAQGSTLGDFLKALEAATGARSSVRDGRLYVFR
ncbi:MAG: hypothetical protein HYZ53_25825 [Planctomycetes bacterium]|nr:hypothetical protein [Planctomycetota bacterium]